MDVQIHIDDRFIRVWRVIRHMFRPVVGLVLVASTAGIVYASTPSEYVSAGTPVSASQMNTILNGLNDRITALENGVAGYEVVQASRWTEFDVAFLEIACPLGKLPVGGGFLVGTGLGQFSLQESRPIGNRWYLEAIRTSPGAGNFFGYAVCINAHQ